MTLWRLAALNPALSPIQRDDLSTQLKEWHITCIEKVRKGRGNPIAGGGNSNIKKNDIEIFTGFKAALESCQLDWVDYQIPGITYMEKSPLHWRFSFGKAQEGINGGGKIGRTKGHATSQVSGCAMKAGPDGGLVPGHLHIHKSQEKYKKLSDFAVLHHTDGSSSEGFCDSDRRGSKGQQDSDSDLGVDIGEGIATPRTSSHSSRKFEQPSSSSTNSTIVTCSNLSKSSRKSNQGLGGGSSGRNNNDDEGLPHEGQGQSSAASALKLPAHVKVMKSDDIGIEALVAAMTASSSAANGGSNKRAESSGNQRKPSTMNEVPASVVGGAAAAQGLVGAAAAGGSTGQAEGNDNVAEAVGHFMDIQQNGNDEYQVNIHDSYRLNVYLKTGPI